MDMQQCGCVWTGFGGIFLGVALIVVRARSLGEAILDLEFRIPRDPVALFGNLLVIASALLLVWLKLSRGKRR